MAASGAPAGARAPAAAKAPEDPNLKLEQRLHQTYLKFNQSPTPESVWENAQSNNASGTYEIQKGDTLWDISETLFGDSQFWPKIWSLNSGDIFNPHEITPEETLQFAAGSLDAPPALSVRGKGEADEKPDPKQPVAKAKPAEPAPKDDEAKKTPEVSEAILSKIEIPPPERKNANARGIPASLPVWQNRHVPMERDFTEVHPNARNIGGAALVLSAYISDGPSVGEGSVVQTELGGVSAATNQYIYVKLTGGTVGQRFLVVKDKGVVQDPPSETGGVLTHVQGTVQIAEAVNPQQSIFRALVTQTFFPIEVGAVLTSGEVPTYTVESPPTSADAPGKVIGGAFSGKRSYYGKDQILFLSSGSGMGLAPGQYISVYKSQPLRDPKTVEAQAPRRIGVIKVLRVGARYSTAVVVSAESEIRTGDLTSPVYR